MKKNAFLLTSVIATLLLSSCKKNYTCTCTVNGATSPISSTSINATKSTAQTDCNNLQSKGVTCTLN